ncbi:2-phosphosulfolactate phosphatase [Virgibacillus sp. C22-A2]|uniref:Probable 2-phosphosulfolactate phosphatase n=1 Tax=Virgibacillus tibetensis TaxID=3042313 RepID=A0ABU6KKZ3_9BACI|nr:2-phosphosulfolactate phosphatase [Virgibacillus sp. C22-A2]
MQITIYQGRKSPPISADITIVIDVIRAFTVAHYAFINGASCIFLAETTKQAFQLKEEKPDYLLAGEEDGLAIEGFDLDNSPYKVSKENLFRKTLIQKTTNGVRATLNCLQSKHLFVTGFTNARNTAEFIKKKLVDGRKKTIHIIASHPSGDDDLACAEYIKAILEDSNAVSSQKAIERIRHSHVADKFFDMENDAFASVDVDYCLRELHSDFVMKINKTCKIPMIERVYK